MTASSFKNAYGSQWAESAGEKAVTIVQEGGTCKPISGYSFAGYNFIEELIPAEANIICRFENGMRAVTVNEFGKGKAVIIGSLLGYSYYKGLTTGINDFLTDIAEMCGIKSVVKVIGGKVRGDMLVNERGETVLILNSSEKRSLEIDIHLSIATGEKKQITNLMTKETLPIEIVPDGYIIRLYVPAMGHEIYHVTQ
jgi:hypothetical protein